MLLADRRTLTFAVRPSLRIDVVELDGVDEPRDGGGMVHAVFGHGQARPDHQ